MIFAPQRCDRAVHVAMVLAAWTLVGMILATQAWIAHPGRHEEIAWTHTLTIWLPWSYLWALLTPLVLKLLSSFPLSRPQLLRAAFVHGFAGLLLAALNLALFAVIAPSVNAVSLQSTWIGTFSRLLATAFLLNVPVYWLIVGIAHSLRVAAEARERERRSLRLEAQLAEARLLMLRSQLEPHFLFNALNTISVLMRENVEAADRVLILLSDLLRRALDTSAAAETELRHEIAFLDAYLALEQVRLGDRLSYRVEIDPQLLDVRVPSLVLQPLVENAVRHGLDGVTAEGRIEVTAACAGTLLLLTVRDNGRGVPQDVVDGVGLSNTRSRLQLLYGNRHLFEVGTAEGGGAVVRVGIPRAMGVCA